MALFTKADLSRATIRKGLDESANSILREAALKFAEHETYDIFVSHSYSDADEILKLKQLIEDMGFTTYVDWIEDEQLDRSKVTKESADWLRKRMKQCRSLFFVTSSTSLESKWMPWELGYFDAFKQRVAILPILEAPAVTNEYKGQEYLGLYPYVTKDRSKSSSDMTLWICESSGKYVCFNSWLEGKMSFTHWLRNLER